MIKLIASDMDETLLDEHSCVPSDFNETMALLKERNVLFMAASGRQYHSLQQLFPNYVNDIVFAAENGTYILYQGKELFASTFSKRTVKNLLFLAATIPDAYAVVCGKKAAYVLPKWKPYLPEMHRYFCQCTIVDSFSEINDTIIEVALCDCLHRDAIHTIYPYLSHLQGTFHLSLSSECWVDIKNPGINKGSAIRHLQQRFHLQPEECAAFGDYLNDKEMMEAVHYSFAMANAQPAVKDAARFHADSNVNHGVIKTIKAFASQGLL